MIGTMEKILADMKSGVFDYTKDGKCSQCGQCCSDLLPMSEKEVKRIQEYIRRKHIGECVNKPPTAEPVAHDFTCPFRDNLNRICTIYEVRPAICRDFRCDKPRKQIEADKRMYHGKYHVVNMRDTFFRKEAEDGSKDGQPQHRQPV